MKKILCTIAIIVVAILLSLFLIFSVLKFASKIEFREDKSQKEKILQIVNKIPQVESVTFFSRSRENSFKYNIKLLFTDGVELSVGDAYLKDNTLYYGTLFWLGDYTEPRQLCYDGTRVFIQHGLFENVTDSDIIEIYHKNNLSCLLEKKR
ncbi:hypothetical protein [Treponema zioleckii]|uniref:hypothetical protein n=1 Tax=Treponema zioleckii TaxID=331680 RepID=UPI00168B71B1|nr:hypothetical protein [Treponema zioleckii]